MLDTEDLSNPFPLLNLPTDRPRPAKMSSTLASYTISLNDNTIERLKNLTLSGGESSTIESVLLATLQVLLYRYTHQDDIQLGTWLEKNSPFNSVDNDLSWIILQSKLSNSVTFQSLLTETQQQLYTLNTTNNTTSALQVVFMLNTLLKVEDVIGVLQKKNERLKTSIDLAVVVTNSHGLLEMSLLYSPELFDNTTIMRISEHYQMLLVGVAKNPKQTVATVPLLTEGEREQLLVSWNDTEVCYPQDQCVHQLFEKQVKKHPNAIALVLDGQQMTYQELNIRANKLAHYLLSLGLKAEALVGLCITRSFEMIIGLLGILKAGGGYIPIDPDYPKERLSFILEDSRVETLLTEGKFVNKENPKIVVNPEMCIQHIICLDSDWEEKISVENDQNIDILVNKNNTVYAIYTSGSTGKPKGVLIPHKGLLNLVFWYQDSFKVTANDKATQVGNIAFDASAFEIWPYLTAGSQLHLIKQDIVVSPHDLQNHLISNNITVTFLPTPLAEIVLSLKWPKTLTLRYMMTGGDRLREFLPSSVTFQLVNVYGPAENSVATTFSLVDSQKFKLPTIGRPVDNHQVYILDQHLQPVPIGVSGELYIGGAGLAKEYLNRPELTEKKFLPSPFSKGRLYRTGDLARYRANGEIEFIGRIDNQVKIRGFRIELGEIEVLLSQHPLIQETIVLVKENIKRNDKYIVAYVVPLKSMKLIERDLHHYLANKLPHYMLPSAWVILPQLPLTPNGKIDRNALPAPQKNRSRSKEAFAIANTEIEQYIASALQSVLQLKEVGIHDNFLDLGANSLLLSKVYHQLSQSFQSKLLLIDLFKYPTVYLLAQHLGQLQKTTKQAPKSLRVRPKRTSSRQKNRRRQARL